MPTQRANSIEFKNINAQSECPNCSGVIAQRICHFVNDMSKHDWLNACNAVISQVNTALTIACGATVVSRLDLYHSTLSSLVFVIQLFLRWCLSFNSFFVGVCHSTLSSLVFVIQLFLRCCLSDYLLLITQLQAFTFAISAAASGFMFNRWRLLTEYDRQRLWTNYGRFCGIMFVNCITGAVTSIAWALFLAAYYQADFNAVPFASPQYFHALSSYALVTAPWMKSLPLPVSFISSRLLFIHVYIFMYMLVLAMHISYMMLSGIAPYGPLVRICAPLLHQQPNRSAACARPLDGFLEAQGNIYIVILGQLGTFYHRSCCCWRSG